MCQSFPTLSRLLVALHDVQGIVKMVGAAGGIFISVKSLCNFRREGGGGGVPDLQHFAPFKIVKQSFAKITHFFSGYVRIVPVLILVSSTVENWP